MNLICGIVLLINLISITNGYVASLIVPPHPDYPGKCYSTITKLAYYPSEFFYHNDNCEKYTCEKYGEHDLIFTIYGCGTRAPPEGGSLYKGGTKKRYPECCPKVAIG